MRPAPLGDPSRLRPSATEALRCVASRGRVKVERESHQERGEAVRALTGWNGWEGLFLGCVCVCVFPYVNHGGFV